MTTGTADYEKVIFNDMNKIISLMNNRNLSDEERKIYVKLVSMMSMEMFRETTAIEARAKMVDKGFLEAKKMIADACSVLESSTSMQVPTKIANEIAQKIRDQQYTVSDPLETAECKPKFSIITVSW